MQRLLIVYNPNSSQYIHVKDEILDHITDLPGIMVGKFEIKKVSFETNVKRLSKVVKDGDLVIAAGGDATADVAANAILESSKDVTLAVLPYGNFNDLARTLGTVKFEDIVKISTRVGDDWRGTPKMFAKQNFGGRKSAGPTRLNIEKLYPLDIVVDGKHWRYATCYVTMGMTAEAVELFDEPKFRAKMQEGHKSSWRSYIALVRWYFKFRHSKVFIPDYSLNGRPVKSGASDYCALSGRSMCRVMKGGYDFLDPKVFRSHSCRLLSFWGISTLMIKSILFRTPGTETTGDEIVFNNPATIKLQAEGENSTFDGIKTIEVKKTGQFIKVLMKNRG